MSAFQGQQGQSGKPAPAVRLCVCRLRKDECDCAGPSGEIVDRVLSAGRAS